MEQPGGHPGHESNGTSDHPLKRTRRTRSRSALALSLAVLAGLLFIGSFLVSVGQIPVLAQAHLGPISAESQAVRQTAPINIKTGLTNSTLIAFQFRATSLTSSRRLFQLGNGDRSLQVLLKPSAGEGASLEVKLALLKHKTLNVVLLDHVVASRKYAINISTSNSQSIVGAVNGRVQFRYTNLQINNQLTPIILGGATASESLGHDTIVTGAQTSSKIEGSPSTAKIQTLLRLLSGLLAASVLALGLIRLSTANWSFAALRNVRRRYKWTRASEHMIAVASLLIGCGVAALAILTPTNNTELQQTGFQQFSSVGVSPGTLNGSDFGGESALLNPTSPTDVHLSFDMKVRSLPIRSRHFFHVVIAAARYDQGVEIDLSQKGVLSAFLGQRYSDDALYLLLSHRIPTGRWFNVDATIVQSQSLDFSVDHQQADAFTYNQPVLKPAPTGLSIGGGPPGTFGGSVKNVHMTVGIYGSGGSPSNGPRRLGQALGFLAIVFGLVLLCQRFLSNRFPAVATSRRRLVQCVFGTAGVLIGLNLVVDLLHLQSSSGPYTSRNSWLFAPYVRFSDFFQAFALLKSHNPYGIQAGSYPPFGYFLVGPLAWMNDFGGLMVFIAVFVGFACWWALRVFGESLRPVERVAMLVVLFASLPVSIGLDRGNVDLWVFILFAIGVALLESRRYVSAASFIALIGAAKIAPGIYLLDFMRRRRLRYVVFGIAVAAVVSLVGFAAFRGTISGNINGFRHALNTVGFVNNTTVISTYYNSSIPGFLQAIGYAFGGLHGSLLVRSAIKPFILPGEVAGLLALIWYLRNRETTLWRSLSLMTLWFLLLQDVAYYYELIFLLVPLAVFIRETEISARSMRIACVFGMVLAPKAYFDLGLAAVDSSVLLTAPLLVALTCYIVRDGVLQRRSTVVVASARTSEVRSALLGAKE